MITDDLMTFKKIYISLKIHFLTAIVYLISDVGLKLPYTTILYMKTGQWVWYFLSANENN